MERLLYTDNSEQTFVPCSLAPVAGDWAMGIKPIRHYLSTLQPTVQVEMSKQINKLER